MSTNLILTEIILLTITAMSALIAWEFYKSKDGQLRVLIIALFICKVYLYGGSAIWFLYASPSPSMLLRIIALNFPMFVVMLKLYGYVRNKR